MKRPLLCILILSCGVLSAQYIWHDLPDAPGSYRHDDVYFLNPLKGWVINPYYGHDPYYNFNPIEYGQVSTTEDGGQTWQTIFDSSLTYIRSVGFADSMNGWFGNLADSQSTPDTNFMYHTTDGGHTWQPVTNINGPRPKGICGISVINDSVIYAYGRYYGPAVILKTTDRGQTWSSQDLGASMNAYGLVDGWFFNADTGFISGATDSLEHAAIFSTFDGGNTWQIRHQTNRNAEECWKVFFPSRNVGYASIEYQGNTISDTTHFLKTTDGGLTWQDHILKTNNLYDEEGIGFINDSVGWIGGDCCQPATFKTMNGGDTWTVDSTFGIEVPTYNSPLMGFSINRFRRFGDTLLYASGNTVYKLQVPQTSTDIQNIMNIGAVKIAPNPFSGNFEISFNTSGLTAIAELELYDITGRPIISDVPVHEGWNKIEAAALKPGVYIYEIKTSVEKLAVGKIVAQ